MKHKPKSLQPSVSNQALYRIIVSSILPPFIFRKDTVWYPVYPDSIRAGSATVDASSWVDIMMCRGHIDPSLLQIAGDEVRSRDMLAQGRILATSATADERFISRGISSPRSSDIGTAVQDHTQLNVFCT